MTKKVLLGLAAAAAIVLAVLSYAGFPPGSRGTEGTIGAANRYRAAQISDKDVVLGDTSGQAFLQSDTFARLLKDPAAVKLLSDARFRSELTANVAQALANPAIVAALTNQQALLALQSFSNCAACGAAVHDQQFVMALRNPEIFAALTNPAFLAAIRANDLASALNAPAMSSALAACGGGCSNLRESLQRPEIVSALSQAQFITMLQTPTFAAAIANPQFVMAVQNSNFVNAIQNPAFASALMDGRLTAALQSQAFLAALTNSGFIASLNAPQLAQALNNALSAGITQY